MKKKIWIILFCACLVLYVFFGVKYLIAQREENDAKSWFLDDVEAAATVCIAQIEPDATDIRIKKLNFEYDSDAEDTDASTSKYPFSLAIAFVQTAEHRYTLYLVENEDQTLVLDRYELTR